MKLRSEGGGGLIYLHYRDGLLIAQRNEGGRCDRQCPPTHTHAALTCSTVIAGVKCRPGSSLGVMRKHCVGEGGRSS